LGCLEPVFRVKALVVVASGMVLDVVVVASGMVLAVVAVFRYSFAISYFEIERELTIRVALGL